MTDAARNVVVTVDDHALSGDEFQYRRVVGVTVEKEYL